VPRKAKHETAPAEERAPVRAAVLPVGVNYYPLRAETQSWSDWYERDVDADFAAFAEAGLSLVRVFVSWHFLEPQVGQYDDDAATRLAGLVSAAKANKLKLIVCFFAEDGMSDMLDVPWAKGRDPRSDAYLVQREVALVQRIVQSLRTEGAIFAWDLANEAFLSGFVTPEKLHAWVTTIRDAIREIDVHRPITMSADPETYFKATSVDPRATLDLFEFSTSHVTGAYRIYAAEGPITGRSATYLDSFLLHAARRDLPVLLDDVGVFSLDYSAFEEAAHLRVALHSALMNGASGVMIRRWRDAETERREPYFRDPTEVLVGVTDVDGRPKPSHAEVVRFTKLCARLARGGHTTTQPRAAVVLPAERWESLPALAGLHAPRSALQAYVCAKEAHVPVTVVREGEELGAYRMLMVPSAFKLGTATWTRLRAFVQGGGSLFVSYGGGDADPIVRELFGVEFNGDGGPRWMVSCRVAQPGMLGALESFDSALPIEHFALLGRGDAVVVATDATGNPLLTVNQYGQGRAVFLAAPAERALAQPDSWTALSPVRTMLRTVYGSLAGAAGAAAPFSCDRPEVEATLLTGESDDVLMALNHGYEKLVADFTFERRVASVADIRGGTASAIAGTAFGVRLAPFDATVLRVTYG
jgi:endo-1,4-beta-mannosidase